MSIHTRLTFCKLVVSTYELCSFSSTTRDTLTLTILL